MDSDIGDAQQISIFLSVFNVHSQCVPIKSKVINKNYIAGKFLAAFRDKASNDNEQTSVLFEDESGNRFKVKQIAGWIARRIINYMEQNMIIERGSRLGFIRFGSRVDIIVPRKFKLRVELGDNVVGNQTIIGYFDEV